MVAVGQQHRVAVENDVRDHPDVILVDRYIDDLMRKAASPADPNHALYVGFERFKARRRPALTCVVRDRTYGSMEVYLVPSQQALPPR